MLPLARTVMGMRPEDVRRAPAQEVVLTGADIDLGRLPVQTCWPGEPAPLITWPLVVTRGPSESAGGRLQPRHLSHAGGRPRPHDHALAGPSRRGPAPPAVEGGRPAHGAAGLRGHRGRSGDHPGGRHARPRHPFGIPVRRPAARRPGRTRRGQDPAVAGPGPRRDRHRGRGAAGRVRGRRALRRPHRLLQFGGAVSDLPGHRHHHAARSDLSDHPHRPAARRAERSGRGAQRGVHPAAAGAIPRDRRLLAAAGGLQLSHRGGVDRRRPTPATPSG